MKRKTISDLHREAKIRIKELEILHAQAEDRFAREAANHHQTHLRMQRYEEDAIQARADYRAAVKTRDEQADRLMTLERINSDNAGTERAIRDLLDGIEAAIPNEAPPKLKLGAAETTTFYHKPSNNGSIAARLGLVMARILARKA